MSTEGSGTGPVRAFRSRFEPFGEACRLQMPELVPLLTGIAEGFRALRDADDTRKTHLFGGRYENIYIERDRIAGLDRVLDVAVRAASEILGVEERLQVGFWFNEMEPGHETTLHSHDDDDELLSGVFYVEVPENSGDLLLGRGENQIAVKPIASSFVFFSPSLPHAVGRNASDRTRLSIGMNFGLPRGS